MLHLMLIKRTKLGLLINALGLCLVLCTTAAVAQELATETKPEVEVKIEEEAVPETAEIERNYCYTHKRNGCSVLTSFGGPCDKPPCPNHKSHALTHFCCVAKSTRMI